MNIETPSLFTNCVLWWPGSLETSDGFPIKPTGVTATPNGIWNNNLDLGNNHVVRTFDGSTSYVSLSQSVSFDIFDADFTICGWINLQSGQIYYSMFDKYINDNNRWQFGYSAGSPLLLYASNGGTVNCNHSTPFNPTYGTWYHVAVVRSGSTCLIYVNSVSQPVTVTQAFRNTNVISAPAKIGSGGGTTYLTKGNYKDLLIYKGRALTVAELTTIMRLTDPRAASMGEGISPGGFDYWRIS